LNPVGFYLLEIKNETDAGWQQGRKVHPSKEAQSAAHDDPNQRDANKKMRELPPSPPHQRPLSKPNRTPEAPLDGLNIGQGLLSKKVPQSLPS
jgi:hypothetical protein